VKQFQQHSACVQPLFILINDINAGTNDEDYFLIPEHSLHLQPACR
jgi:hypothetical protein